MSRTDRSIRPSAVGPVRAVAAGALAIGIARTGPRASGQGPAAEGRNIPPARAYRPDEDQAVLELFGGPRVADGSDGMDAVGLPDTGLMDPRIAPLWRDLEAFNHRSRGVAVAVRHVPTDRRAAPENLGESRTFQGRWYRERSPEPFVDLLRAGSVVLTAPARWGGVGPPDCRSSSERDTIMPRERGPWLPPSGPAFPRGGARLPGPMRSDAARGRSGGKSMVGSWPAPVLVPAAMFAAVLIASGPGTSAQAAGVGDESFFVEKVYPVLHAAQCERCHSDNGVASETRLQFPEPDAGAERITAFGLSMIDLIDRRDPERSLLLRKPTKRVKHSGGQRIKPGSADEAVLRRWIQELAGLSDERVRRIRERIARSEHPEPEAPAVRRLTHSQYNHTVRDLLGDRSQPAGAFPKEDYVNGFKNQVEAQGISPLQAEAYSKAAERLARAAFRGGDQHGLIPRRPRSPTDAEAVDAFVRRFGLRAFRRPLTDAEVRRYSALFLREAGRTGDFHAGASMVIEAMLQSPHFLFRIERGADGPDAPFEIASRLSYFLWDTMPSDELLRAAREGRLATTEQVEATARRMLEDPRARAAMEEFLAQWMRFDRVLESTRDRRRFREFNAEIAAAMVEETRRLFNHLVWGDRNFLEFFTADYTFVNPDLARLYGLPAPGEEFAKVAYPADSGRAGVLGHGSFLVLTSKPAETSPTARGLFVRNQFLAQEIPPPPAGLNTALPNITEDSPMTNRQRLDVHLNSESCAGCHRLIDPIGLGFEQYNAIGVFQKKMVLQFIADRDGGGRGRRTIKELDVDPSGYIQGMENSAFSTPKELGRLLAGSPTCQKAIVKQLFRYAFGRQETEKDQPAIDAMLARFRDRGFRFRELIVAVATSDLFLQKGSE